MRFLILCATFLMIIVLPSLANEQGSIIQDGIKTEIGEAGLEELKDWAQNTQKELRYFNERLTLMENQEDKLSFYERKAEEIVLASTGINALLMRKSLNRARFLSNLIRGSSSKQEAFRLELYKIMFAMAQNFYQSDIEFINSQSRDPKDYINASLEALQYLKDISILRKTKISNREFSDIEKKFIAFINQDLFNSSLRTLLAFEINQINDLLETWDGSENAIRKDLYFLLEKVIENLGFGLPFLNSSKEIREFKQCVHNIYNRGETRWNKIKEAENRCLNRFLNNNNYTQCLAVAQSLPEKLDTDQIYWVYKPKAYFEMRCDEYFQDKITLNQCFSSINRVFQEDFIGSIKKNNCFEKHEMSIPSFDQCIQFSKSLNISSSGHYDKIDFCINKFQKNVSYEQCLSFYGFTLETISQREPFRTPTTQYNAKRICGRFQ